MYKKWDELPDIMKNDSVYEYYKLINDRRTSLIAKRFFDIIVAILVLLILSPIFLILAVAIKIDSKGSIMYRQVRITQYGKKFRIYKFRTMINDADKMGAEVTSKNDVRVTRVGSTLRILRLDEIPQLFNIILGDMSFVGTRPEVPKYVEKYTDEMMATLLLPAGVTSEASIKYKDEEQLLSSTENVDETYVNEVLPEKMKYNLRSIEGFSLRSDIKTMVQTASAVFLRNSNVFDEEDRTAGKREVK